MREYTLENASKTKKLNFKAIEKTIKKGFYGEKKTVEISEYYEAKVIKAFNQKDRYYIDVLHRGYAVDSFNARLDINGEVVFYYCPINAR